MIKDKWEAAGNNRGLKNKIFEVYLACGGDVGKMVGVERLVKAEIHKLEGQDSWFTEDTCFKLGPARTPKT